jgi:predicted short-subunit dehydrogenase-like oxidoreductase (DUF2520 family)
MITKGSVVVVGRGRLGSALLAALPAAGLTARGVGGREVSSGSGSQGDLSGEISLVLLSVPDDALIRTAERLAGILPKGTHPPIVHLSGALDSSVLAPLAERGCPTGSCHPLQSFSSGSGAAAFRGIVFAVEGAPAAVEAGSDLARRLGGRPVTIEASSKPLYHAAAHLASGGLAGLLGAAIDLLGRAGFSEADARATLGPLARRTLERALEEGPAASLTGPVARGDTGTLALHRRAIAASDPGRSALYEALVAEQERLRRS